MQPLRRRSFFAGIAGTLAMLNARSAFAAPPRHAALARGAKFGRWTVADVNPHAGALLVEVEGEAAAFTLEVMALDPAPEAAQPPAKTEHLAVFVRNGGNGRETTAEDHGLAAVALAARLASGDADLRKGLLTHRERLTRMRG